MVNYSSRSTFERFYYRSEGSAAYTRAVLQSENSSRYIVCSKCIAVPLVSTVPCIRNTIHRFSEDEVRMGKMDCIWRWRIQGTVQSHPHFRRPYITFPSYSALEMVEEDDLGE